MPLELIAIYTKVPVFLLVVCRLGGLLLYQPIISGAAVPAKLQILLVLALSALVAPFVNLHSGTPATPIEIVFAMANELLLGILMGLVLRMCFVGLQLGAQVVAQEAGLAFGRVADPTTGDDESIFASMYVQLGAIIFLIIGGHRVLLAVALDTFDAIPLLGDQGTFVRGVDLIVDALTLGTEIAVRLAAPVLLTLFLVTAAMGFISRTVPQLNILTVGFSVKGLVGFVLMAISLPAAFEAFTAALETTVQWVSGLAGS